MAVPKRRMSRSRTHHRRAQHDRLTAPTLSSCSNCGSPVRPHHVCSDCGQYRGKQIVAPIIELAGENLDGQD
jgi:large subunit ribosomal protein L32